MAPLPPPHSPPSLSSPILFTYLHQLSTSSSPLSSSVQALSVRLHCRWVTSIAVGAQEHHRRNTADPLPQDTGVASTTLDSLASGIIQARLDLELKPLWSKSSSKSKVNVSSFHIFLAIPVGIKQKSNVDDIVQKFLLENFTIMLVHYDGNVDEWQELLSHMILSIIYVRALT
ncbi:uncharacterized protein LOC114300607 [Camellia sinensis]|uniref:uncharacterized protein LOC114300607 n=1 Tax=Camellia sinensis TaxID=4442 RepID=UPI0010356F83|nr:uncharacterized protein LOC114300607 [Camellia sinensis]